ncbi:MAG: hypothetical protein ABSG41_13985 [Bryobacteraceae bacterium]|jgi:hypothetical protein
MRNGASALLFLAVALEAQAPNDLNECLDALARSAANFAASAPGLMAEETLDQRGRRGFIEILKGKKDEVKDLDFTLPEDFRSHHVISNYGLAEIGDARVLHEIRTIVTMDGQTLSGADEVRHALTMGPQSADDETKRRLLENLEHNQLEGAVTDFGQVLLLFAKRHQSDYRFSVAGRQQRIGDEPVVVIRYRQVSGAQGLTFFKERTEEHEPAAGQIWFRLRDLVPIRITFNTEEFVSKKFRVRTEATVDYASSPVGLVPASVTHKQFLNSALMVENDLRYGEFHRADAMLP